MLRDGPLLGRYRTVSFDLRRCDSCHFAVDLTPLSRRAPGSADFHILGVDRSREGFRLIDFLIGFALDEPL